MVLALALEYMPKLVPRPIYMTMAIVVWGISWFALSIITYVVLRLLPSLQPPPPQIIVIKTRAPRVRSPTPSPKAAVQTMPPPAEEAPDHASVDSAPQRCSSPEGAPSQSPIFKPKWSFSSAWVLPSPRPSDASLDSPASSEKGLRILPKRSSTKDVLEARDEVDVTPSPSNSPHLVPRTRMSTMTAIKAIGRKISIKQKSKHVPISESPSPASMSLNESFEEGEEKATTQQDDVPSPERPRMYSRTNSLSGEVFRTSFVSPFRIRSPKQKPSPIPAHSSPPTTPSPRRPSGSRRMLTSLHLALSSTSSSAQIAHAPAPDSPRSSLSSVATSASTFSSPSTGSTSSSPRGVPRTRPYGAPYFAAMPVPVSAQGGAGKRRATSLSLDRRATVAEVEEVEAGDGEGEADENLLGLEFGVHGGRERDAGAKVASEPRRRTSRHRSAASESAVRVAR